MTNPYHIVPNDNAFVSLKVLYQGMPETRGCEKCAEINGSSQKDYCCKELNPSMFYVEFLYVWNHVNNTWTKDEMKQLICRAIGNYLSNNPQKGCIFYKNGCLIHSRRPLSCRAL
jgi:Fe-S-cluster containining protein